jgi:hypothetical protein
MLLRTFGFQNTFKVCHFITLKIILIELYVWRAGIKLSNLLKIHEDGHNRSSVFHKNLNKGKNGQELQRYACISLLPFANVPLFLI